MLNLREFFCHPVPHRGIEVEADMAAQYLDIVHVAVVALLPRCAPVHHAVPPGVDGGGGYRRFGDADRTDYRRYGG